MMLLPTPPRSPSPRPRRPSWPACICAALLTLTLGGCCFCGEAVEKLGDAGEGATSSAGASADPGAAPDDPAEAKPPAPAPAEGLDALDADRIRAVIEAQGWKLLGDPNPTKAPTHTATMFSVIKPPMGGVVSLYVYTKDDFAARFVETMTPQDAALHRQGAKVLAVTIPGNRDHAQQLLDALVQKTP